jgi:hypothetical protein
MLQAAAALASAARFPYPHGVRTDDHASTWAAIGAARPPAPA